MVEPSIRRADPSDAEPLARLGEASFRETFLVGGFAIPYPAEDLQAFLAEHYAPTAFAAKLVDRRGATWVAEMDGEPIAYASVGPCILPHPDVRGDELELHRLYVLRRAQGLGLGRRLLETALAWMDEVGGAGQWLGVWSGNLKAQRLYAAYGFVRVGGYQFPVGRCRDEEFILRRSAPPPAISNTGA